MDELCPMRFSCEYLRKTQKQNKKLTKSKNTLQKKIYKHWILSILIIVKVKTKSKYDSPIPSLERNFQKHAKYDRAQ